MEIAKYSDIYKDDPGLRSYQQQAKKEIFESWDEVDSVMFQMPTGTGKTRLFSSIISDINNYSLRRKEAVKILIIAHRTELIDQIDEHLKKYRVPHNIIAGGRDKHYKYPVSIASIQTITNANNRKKAERLNIQFVIIDEAHHALAVSYKKLWDMYPDAKRLGVTATPWRMNHQSFCDLFDKLVLSMPVKDFIKQGYLSPYKYYSLKGDSKIQKTIDGIELDRFGEYKESSMEEKMDIGSIRAQLLDSYLSYAEGKKGIIYAINIVHAKHICKEYEEAGYKAVSIDSKTKATVRKDLVDKFKRGEIDIIVNVDIFSEGFDCPDIEFIQLARPTRSLVKYLQQVGRGLRQTENKEHCVILDNVGMYSRFNLPDARRHWRYHFLGKKVDEEPKIISLKGTGRHRIVDMSEGTEDMELIQDISEDVEVKENLSPIHHDLGTSPNFSGEPSSAINSFFPLWGVILGKTTWKQVEDMGYGVEVWKNGPGRYSDIGGVTFWDHNGDGIFTSVYMTRHRRDNYFPPLWKEKGFSWYNSFDTWFNVFKKLGYNITIKSQPTRIAYSRRNTLSAEFDATSADGTLSFEMNFNYGENGYYTSSPRTLYSITVNYNGNLAEDKTNEDSQSEKFFYDNNDVRYREGVDTLIKYPNQNHYETIEVPEFITNVNSRAFEGITVSEIIFHDGIQVLQDFLFVGCLNLRTITIKSDTPDNILIDKNAFNWFDVENCVLRVPFDALASYKGDEKFKRFKYITAIEGSRCLLYDENGTKVIGCDEGDCETLRIPEGVTGILDEAFEDNKAIKTISFPESLTSIGSSAFSGCSGITNIELNDELEELGFDAFRGTGLTEVEIPYNVKDIGATAFNCEIKVASINTDFYALDGVLFDFFETKLILYPSNKQGYRYEVPDDIIEIGYFAFEDSCLKSISLPDSIKALGTNIFCGCTNLTELIIKVENPNEIQINKDTFNNFEKSQCKLIVPQGCSELYSSHKMFKDFFAIQEMDNQKYENTINDSLPDGELVPGQFFNSLSNSILSESKPFYFYGGSYHCSIVMTRSGFYLELVDGGYYFLSSHNCRFANAKIWVQNQKGKSTDYDVSYTTDDRNGIPFGHIKEHFSVKSLTYRDYNTGKSFTLDLRTKKTILYI